MPEQELPPLVEIRADGAEDWRLVQRIVASRWFVRAPQVKAMLLFIARRALFEGATEISETAIACGALGRRPGFDPKEDNIVRVQAYQLRTKLEKYFSNEGASESIILSIPKRSYVPRFQPRTAAESRAAGTEDAGEETEDVLRPLRLRRGTLALVLGLSIGFAFIAGTDFGRRRGRPEKPSAGAKPANSLCGRVFHRDRPTTLIIADNGLTSVQDLLGTDVTLEEYLRPDYAERLLARAPAGDIRNMMRHILPSQMTSVADAIVASRLTTAGQAYGATVVVRSARALNVRDLNEGSFVMVGSRRAVPWVELFEDRLNFRSYGSPRTLDFWFANRVPSPGEQLRYGIQKDADQVIRESYADLALLPGPGDRGAILLLAGLTMDATEASAVFAEHGRLPPELADWMADEHHYCELLLHTKGVPGQTWNATLIAYRKIDAAGPQPAHIPRNRLP